MKKFLKKYYIQLIIIVLLFCANVYMLVESRRIMTMVGEQSVELKQTQLDRVVTAEYVQNIHSFKKDAAYIDENSHIFDVILPNTDDAKVDLFSSLESLASETGHEKVLLTVRQEDPKKKKSEDEAAQSPVLGINISVIGSYNELLAYVQKIENMQYLSSITSFNIEKIAAQQLQRENIDPEEVAEDDLIKTSMTIDFYLLSSEKE